MALSGKTFRIFISSTFSDLKAERDALQREVFPKIGNLCMRHGCRFQAIDLRWGVSDEAALDQQTVKICLEEIARCQQVTPRPNFVILLGDRYGWRPLPAEIPAAEFSAIEKRCEQNDKVLLDAWYKKDDNAVPPVYCLLPRSGEHADPAAWEKVERRLLALLQRVVSGLDFTADQRLKYFASATEQEIVHGALRSPLASKHVHCFFRSIQGLPRDMSAHDFIDLDDKGAPDREASDLLADLRGRLCGLLPQNTYSYDTVWTGDGVDPGHIGRLCADAYDALSRIILEEIARIKETDPLENEVLVHEEFGRERARSFIGRAAMLQAIAEYAKGNDPRPLAIVGESGSGKSALMAHAVHDALRNHPGQEIIYRFIGATADSADGRSMLESLCRQISRRVGADETTIPAGYKELVQEFPKRMALATKDKPLILFLDALDQLPDADQARGLAWLPADLPRHARLVVSTLPGECATALERKLPRENLMTLEPMPGHEGRELMDLWLQEAGRTLQPGQAEEVAGNFIRCGLPLYLKLAFEEARKWKSYAGVTALSPDIPGIIRDLLRRMAAEASHGGMMVSRSLGYLAAAKNGLTENELIDVLSSDIEVIGDFLRRSPKSPVVRQLPVVVWSRLYFDLEPYLSERAADGTTLMTFYHRQLGEVVRREFLANEAKKERHAQLARYFGGLPLWIDQNNKREPNLRIVSELPFQQANGGLWDELEKTLAGLHFIEAKCAAGMTYDLIADYHAAFDALPEAREERRKEREQEERVKKYTEEMIAFSRAWNDARGFQERVPWNFQKQQAKNISFPEVMRAVAPWSAEKINEEADRIVHASTRLDRLRAYSQFVVSESHVLGKCASLPGFVMQQAYNAADSGPIASEAEKIIESERMDRDAMLLQMPANRLRFNPFPALVKTVETPSSAKAITPDGRKAIWAGRDNALEVWDIEKNVCLKILREHSEEVKSICITPDCRTALSRSEGMVIKWDVEAGSCLKYRISQGIDVETMCISADGKAVILCGCIRIDGPLYYLTVLKADDMKQVLYIRMNRYFSDRKPSLHIFQTRKGHRSSIQEVVITPDGRSAFTGSTDHTIKVWDLMKGKCTRTLKGHASLISALCITPDGNRAVSGDWDGELRIWDVQRGKCLKAFQGDSSIAAVSITPDGRFAVSGSSMETNQKVKDCSLSVWDVENGSCLKTLHGHADYVQSVSVSPDGRSAVSSDSATIRYWDITKAASVQVPEWHTQPVEGVALTACGKLAVSGCSARFWGKAKGSFAVKTWNVDSGECRNTLVGHSGGVYAVGLTPDDRIIASASGGLDMSIRLWELESGKCLKEILGNHTALVKALSIPKDGRAFVSAGMEKKTGAGFKHWDLETGFCKKTSRCGKTRFYSGLLGRTYTEVDEQFTIACLSADGKTAVSVIDKKCLNVLNSEDGKRRRTLKGHRNKIVVLSITPDGRTAISGCELDVWKSKKQEALRIWNVRRGTCRKTIKRKHWHFTSLCIAPDGKTAVSGEDDSFGHNIHLNVWDLRRGIRRKILKGHTGAIMSVSITRDGRGAVSVSKDGTLKVWDLQAGICSKTLQGHKKPILKVQATPDGKTAVSVTDDNVIEVWDLEQGICQTTIRDGYDKQIDILSLSLDGKIILSGSSLGYSVKEEEGKKESIYDGTTKVWNAANGKCLKILEQGHGENIIALKIVPDGSMAISGGKDKQIKVWDMESGFCRRTLAYNGDIAGGKSDPLENVFITPDGYWIICGDMIWELHGSSCRQLAARIIAVAGDGRRALTRAWDDQSLQLLDLADGSCRCIIEEPSSGIRSAIITPDAGMAMAICGERTIKLWSLADGACIAMHHEDAPIRCLSNPAAGRFTAGTEAGRVIFFKWPQGRMSAPFCTPGRIRHVYMNGEAGRWDDKITAACPWCGARFPAHVATLEAIRRIGVQSHIAHDDSPCLKLPREAWEESALLSQCPACRKPLRYNPFIVDDRERS